MKETVLSFWEEVRTFPQKEQQAVMDQRKGEFLDHFFEWLSTIPPWQWFMGFDYDGDLAPLNPNPMQAFPYPGVPERLDSLSERDVPMAIITGGEVARILQLIVLRHPIHISGNHGWEHHTKEGTREWKPVPRAQRRALDRVEKWMEKAEKMAVGVWYERKHAGLVLHWRNLLDAGDQATIALIDAFMEASWREVNLRNLLRFDHIDGGIEIRAKGMDKGKVFTQLMAGAAAGAYFGDDITDEDVFRAIRYNDDLLARALGVLVRQEWKRQGRPGTDAAVQLKPPGELLLFLDRLDDTARNTTRRVVNLPPLRLVA